MKIIKYITAAAFISFCLLMISARPDRSKSRILIFSKTNGYRHASIPVGIEAIKKLGAENGFEVDATEDSTWFNKKTLRKYAAIVFLSPTGKVFGPAEEEALKGYIHKGGGYVGIHAATDCEYGWAWYGELAGAYFKSHPKQQQAKLVVVNKDHPSTRSLPDTWERFDEWYNFKNLSTSTTVLIKIDETSYTGGENGENHPMAWYHEFEGGRAFYTELGHTDESFADSNYLHHILGGIEYAMGKTGK
jgi:type 1 glutamine amidotransferase